MICHYYYNETTAAPRTSGVLGPRLAVAILAAVPALATTSSGIIPALEELTTHRASTVTIWVKHIIGVLICGALMALGNWVYSLFSDQWNQSGLPTLPVMVARPGGGHGPATAQLGGVGLPSTPGRGAATSRAASTSFLDEWKD